MSEKWRDERRWRVSAVLACAAFGLPMLLIREHPWHALCAWLIVVGVYLGLLLLFGTGFVLEGALLGFILALVLATVLDAMHQARAPEEVGWALPQGRVGPPVR